MKKHTGRLSKKTSDYLATLKELRVNADPAAKVLLKIFLKGHNREQKTIDYASDAALIEMGDVKAEEVIANTADLIRRIDPRFKFIWRDFKAKTPDQIKDKFTELISNMTALSKSNPFAINVIRNINTCCQSKEVLTELQEIYLSNKLGTLNFLYVFDENSYNLYSEKIYLMETLHPIWLHHPPGDADFNEVIGANGFEQLSMQPTHQDIFTAGAKALICRAKRQAENLEEVEIDTTALFIAAVEGVNSCALIGQCLNISAERLKCLRGDLITVREGQTNEEEKFLFSNCFEQVVKDAVKLASAYGYPDHKHPGLVAEYHLIAALAMSESIKKLIGTGRILQFQEAANKIANWYNEVDSTPFIAGETDLYRKIGMIESANRKLIGNVFGQHQAISSISKILSSVEFKNKSLSEDHGLRATLLFIGAEGVGKQYLAGSLAESLNLPLQYIDLALNANEGQLSIKPPAKYRPETMLVFGNIDKASQVVKKQICDLVAHGKLADQRSGEVLDFNGSIVIILAAIDVEMAKAITANNIGEDDDYFKGLQLLPSQLLALLSKQQIISFRRLNVEDLLNICARKMAEIAAVIDEKGKKLITFDPLVPQFLLFTEGGKPSPRAICAAVEMLAGAEVMKFVFGEAKGAIKYLMTLYDRIHFKLEKHSEMNDEVAGLFHTDVKPRILLFSEREVIDYYNRHIDNVDWCPVESLCELENVLEREKFDYALLDLWITERVKPFSKKKYISNFLTSFHGYRSNVPLSACALELFEEKYLRIIGTIADKLPLVMLNRIDNVWEESVREYLQRPSSFYLEAAAELRIIREQHSFYYPIYYGCFRYDYFMELFASLGIRGLLNADFNGKQRDAFSEKTNSLSGCLNEIHQILHREKMSEALASRGQVLAYEPIWEIEKNERLVNITLKNLRLEGKVTH